MFLLCPVLPFLAIKQKEKQYKKINKAYILG